MRVLPFGLQQKVRTLEDAGDVSRWRRSGVESGDDSSRERAALNMTKGVYMREKKRSRLYEEAQMERNWAELNVGVHNVASGMGYRGAYLRRASAQRLQNPQAERTCVTECG